ncbi:MAG: hypothetical protein V4653_15400 [Pseudomonadota bacterium]
MALPALRAKQSTDTVGTGTLALNPAAAPFRSYAAAFGGSSVRVPYVISWATGFEIGYGDFNGLTPGSLTRATVIASSNAGVLVSLPAGTKDVFAFLDPWALPLVSIAGGYTATLADLGNAILFTGSTAQTLALPAFASVPPGAGYLVQNNGTATLTIDPSGAETIDGVAAFALGAGSSLWVIRSGAGWTKVGTLGGASAVGAAVATAVDTAAARAAIAAPATAGFPNLIINGKFQVNQRGYASGSATGAAAQYTLDRWRVVTAGQNLAWVTSGNGNRITAPAGGVEQVIESANIAGGSYVANWTGTATLQVNGSARTKGEVFTLAAGSNATARLISGTAEEFQIEPGTVPTLFEVRPPAVEQLLCSRYCTVVTCNVFGYHAAGGVSATQIRFPLLMRATPSLTPFGTTPSFANVSSEGIYALNAEGFAYAVEATTTGGFSATNRQYLAQAEL